MCPKAKPDTVVNYRLELQDHEREALDMVAASIALRNVGSTVNSILDPLFKMTPSSAVLFGAALTGFSLLAAADEVTDVLQEQGIISEAPGAIPKVATAPWFVGAVADFKSGIAAFRALSPIF
jgi:hypothetical protein